MVQIKQKSVYGVETLHPRSILGGVSAYVCMSYVGMLLLSQVTRMNNTCRCVYSQVHIFVHLPNVHVVCMCICVCVCVYVHVIYFMYVRLCACVYTCTRTCVCVCVYLSVHAICTWTCMFVCVYMHTYVCVCICIYICQVLLQRGLKSAALFAVQGRNARKSIC